MSEIYKIVSEIERNQVVSKLKKGKRLDGRALDEFREWRVQTNLISKAEGSARVDLGNTKVIVGVKAELGEPYPDTPNEGVVTVMAELVPMAHPTYEPGPPAFDAIELARVVDRGLRHSEIVDREKLCIVPGEKVWILFIDIYVLDYDGNLIDAASIGAVAALMTAKLPEVKITDGEVVFSDDKKVPVPLKDLTGAVTIAKIDDVLVLDPTSSEERIMDGRITVSYNKNNEIVSIQKSGSFLLSNELLQQVIELSSKTAKEIIEKLSKVK
ncbi:MAG: exosome complex protein Rrp42 [Candidatus Odinarchaeia archaeon]